MNIFQTQNLERVKVELYLFNYAAKTDLEKGHELIHHLLLKK